VCTQKVKQKAVFTKYTFISENLRQAIEEARASKDATSDSNESNEDIAVIADTATKGQSAAKIRKLEDENPVEAGNKIFLVAIIYILRFIYHCTVQVVNCL
jgi:hypothetical protein